MSSPLRLLFAASQDAPLIKTGGLADVAAALPVALRELDTRLAYLREMQDRCASIIAAIDEQGKLTPALRQALEAAATKQELEDLLQCPVDLVRVRERMSPALRQRIEQEGLRA